MDNSHTMRAIIRTALRDHGYRYVLEADDGDSALDILLREPVDIVLSDWLMDRMSGIELLKAMRANRETASLPFIMVTSAAQRKYVVQAFRHGVSHYLVKPFQPAKLIERMETVLHP